MQIEYGKFYVDGEGEKIGPIEPRTTTTEFIWTGKTKEGRTRIYKADGTNYEPGPWNLIAEWSEPAVAAPHPPTDPVKHMVDRFLAWKLPEHFLPDCGIRFSPSFPDEPMRSRHWPTGTNLFDASQAEAMVRYMIEGLPLPHLTDPMWVNVDEAGKTTPLVDVNELERLRRMVKAHADHEMNLAKQIDAMTDTASICRAECERLKKREAELLEANNRYLERARDAEAKLGRQASVANLLRPTLRDCPMCGADGSNDEIVCYIENNLVGKDWQYVSSYEIRCLECGVSVADERANDVARIWNGKQNAEQCTACGEYLDEGDLVYIESGEGGFIHANCCDKSDVTAFTDEDGNPLQPGDKIPEPIAWEGGAA